MNRAVDAYVRAVELEASSESIYYEAFGIGGAAQRIPRVLSLLGPVTRHGAALDLLLPLASLVYAIAGAPVFYLVRALRLAWRRPVPAAAPARLAPGCDLYLATSSGANLAFVPEDGGQPAAILTTPFRGVVAADVLPAVPRVAMLGYLRAADLGWAWGQATLASWRLATVDGGRTVLWAYTALEWMVAYRILQRIRPATIRVSNHHDRWLVLALSVSGAAVQLIQHGRLYHTLPDGRILSYRRSKRLAGIAKIFALDERSEQLFCDYLDCQGVKFHRLCMQLQIMPWRASEAGQLRILVIGGSNKLPFYLQLMDALDAAFHGRAALAIRHHPLQKGRLSELRPALRYWELAAGGPAPEPDVVVTYGSSIDDQLASCTEARLVQYAWSDAIDIGEIVHRVQLACSQVRAI